MPYPPQGTPKAETWIFTELAGGEDHQVSAIDTWEDWDLSAIVPGGTKAVLIHAYSRSLWGARKNGTALDRKTFACGDGTTHKSAFILTEVDLNRVVELYVQGTVGYTVFSIVGYWSI